MKKIIPNDPLLEFFESITESEEEFQIIKLVSKNLQEEEIIENLINYKPASNDKV